MDNKTWVKESQTVSTNTRYLTLTPFLDDKEPEELARFPAHFENKTFLKQEAQGFPQYTLFAAYEREQTVFIQNVNITPKAQVPLSANAINGPVINKVKKW